MPQRLPHRASWLWFLFLRKGGAAMFDYEEDLDLYLDKIKDLLGQKQYAAVRDLLLPL